MNEQRLKNIWNRLTADGKTTSDFETWMSNISNNPNVQMNVHTYLVEQKLTQNDFDTWSTNTGLKKKRRKRSISFHFSNGKYGVYYRGATHVIWAGVWRKNHRD